MVTTSRCPRCGGGCARSIAFHIGVVGYMYCFDADGFYEAIAFPLTAAEERAIATEQGQGCPAEEVHP